MKLQEAKSLKIGQEVYYAGRGMMSDGGPQRARVSGKVQTWKRDESRVRVPLKVGFRGNAHIDEGNVHMFYLDRADAWMYHEFFNALLSNQVSAEPSVVCQIQHGDTDALRVIYDMLLEKGVARPPGKWASR